MIEIWLENFWLENISSENISLRPDDVIIGSPDSFENEAIENFWIENVLPPLRLLVSENLIIVPENLGKPGDSDADCIPDWYENILMNADPHHKDIFVEIDRMRGDALDLPIGKGRS